PPRLGRGIEGSTRDDRVDQPPGLRVLDEDADALAQRIDRRRVRIGELHAATELERAARGVAALAELQRRPDERGGFGVVARIARVADPVGVAVGLIRVGDGLAVVDGIADAVVVLIARRHVRGARGRRAGAGLLGVTLAGRRTADERARLEPVRRALTHRPVAGLRDVAVAGRRAALEARRQDIVGRAEISLAVARLGHVARAHRRPADGGALRVGRAVVADPVAALGEIALAARQPADGGALRVRRAGGVGTGAPLGEVAVAGSRAALHRGRLEGVLGASGARPGAALRDVAVAGGGPALDAARLEAIGRAEGARPGAALGDVAVAGRRAAFGARREQDVGRAVVMHSVAGLGDVAGPGRGPADLRALRVGRAIGTRPGAELRCVAVAGGGAADDVRAVLIHGVDAGSRAVTDVLRAGIRVVRARARCSLRRTDTLGVLAGVEAGAGIQVVAGGAVGECRSGAPAPAAHAVLGAVVRVAARGLVRERRAGADA